MALPLALLPLFSLLMHEPLPDRRHDRHDDLPAVSGGFAAPGAWLALWRGDAWICWDASAPGCWQRLELAGVVDLPTLRAEFLDRSTLVVADRSEVTWLLVRPDPTPRPTTAATTPRHSPRAFGCSAAGVLPIADASGLGFVACDAPPGDTLCVRPGRSMPLRPASPLRLRVGLELRALEDWRMPGLATSAATGVQLLATIGFGLDPGWASRRRERADLQAQARPALRALPASRSRGPLMAEERQALRAVLCGGAT